MESQRELGLCGGIKPGRCLQAFPVRVCAGVKLDDCRVMKAPWGAPVTREGGGIVLFWEDIDIPFFFVVVFILSKRVLRRE